MTAKNPGYLQLPHPTRRKAVAAGLTGAQWDVVILCTHWTYGQTPRKETCTMGLTSLAKFTARSKQTLSRARQGLVEIGIINLVEQHGDRRASRYSLNLQEDTTDETVTQMRQSQECDSEADRNLHLHSPQQSHARDGQSHPRDPLSHLCDPDSHADETLIRTTYLDLSCLSTSDALEPPLKGPSGTIVDCAKNAQPTSDLSDQKLSEADSQGVSPPCRPGTPPKAAVQEETPPPMPPELAEGTIQFVISTSDGSTIAISNKLVRWLTKVYPGVDIKMCLRSFASFMAEPEHRIPQARVLGAIQTACESWGNHRQQN